MTLKTISWGHGETKALFVHGFAGTAGAFSHLEPLLGDVFSATSVELPGFTLRYTTDGSEPTARSPVVSGPITARGTIHVAAFNASGRKGQTARVRVPPT